MEATEVKDTKEREIVAHYTSEETHALAQLRLKFPPPSPRSRTPTIEDHVMMRFLRARQLDVNAAFDMLNAALLWRKNNNIDNVLSAPLPTNMNILRSIVPQGWHGFDKFGRPVLYNKIGQMHLDYFVKMDTECIDECHIWEMEMGLRLMAESSAKRGERVSQMVTILDLKGLGLSHRKTIRFMKGTSFLDKFYYPETLGKLYMINAPRVAPVLWAIAKPLLDPRTQEKVTILGADYQKVLQELIPADQLPTEYGGACKCKGAHTQCLPEVSAAEAKKIFADYKYAVKVTPKLTELQVASRGRQEVSVPIKASKGGEVSYSFHSAKNDIEFSILFTPAASAPSSSSTVETKKDKQEKLTVLLEPSRQTGSTDEPVSGVVAAPSAGVVRFVFDNSYSRFTAKTIFYHVHAIEDATPPPEPAESKADLAKDFATVKVAEEPAVRGLDATVKVAEEPAVRGLDEGINWVS